MSEKELVPLSIRLSDDVISILKQKARHLSYNSGKDVSYTDLIRHAVSSYVNNIRVNQDRDISVEENCLSESSGFAWLGCMNSDEWMDLFGLRCNSMLSNSVNRILFPMLEKLSIPRAILLRNIYSHEKSYNIRCGHTVFAISNRGAVPNEISGSNFIPPIFKVGCYPQIELDAILRRDVDEVIKMVNDSAYAIAKEETACFENLIEKASSRQKFEVPEITLESIVIGYDSLISNRRNPNYLLVSRSVFLSLSREAEKLGKGKGNWEFGSLVSDNSDAGHFNGARIKIMDCMDSYSVYFLSISDGAYFVEKGSANVIISPSSGSTRASSRSGLVIFIDIGMFIHDDMASCVFKKGREQHIIKMG